jgi:hypothetical protein
VDQGRPQKSGVNHLLSAMSNPALPLSMAGINRVSCGLTGIFGLAKILKRYNFYSLLRP